VNRARHGTRGTGTAQHHTRHGVERLDYSTTQCVGERLGETKQIGVWVWGFAPATGTRQVPTTGDVKLRRGKARQGKATAARCLRHGSPLSGWGACLLGGDGEQGYNAADWVRGTGMQIPPTYPLQQASANIAGDSLIGEGEKKNGLGCIVLDCSAVERVGSGRNATEYHTSALSDYRLFSQGVVRLGRVAEDHVVLCGAASCGAVWRREREVRIESLF
jgi:hypothetical protein